MSTDREKMDLPEAPTSVRVLLANDRLGYDDAPLHGAGRLILEWIRMHSGSEVEVFPCILRAGGTLEARLRREGVSIDFFGHSRFDPRSLWRLVRVIREKRIQVLHLQGYGASTLGRIAGLLTGTPSIVHVHDEYDSADGMGYPAYLRALDRLLARRTTLAIAVSETVRTFCLTGMGFDEGQVIVVHNPIPSLALAEVPSERIGRLREEYGIAEGAPVIGVTSRLYPVKGHRVLLEAFSILRQEVPEAVLLVVGDGPERRELERICRESGMSPSVVFAGFQDDVGAHLRLMSVLAVPSTHAEPFGLSALEALATGIPVVASRVGGLPEVVDEEAGALVQPNNPRELASAIVRILKQVARGESSAERCRRSVERFSTERHAQTMRRLYAAVAIRGRQGSRMGSIPEGK